MESTLTTFEPLTFASSVNTSVQSVRELHILFHTGVGISVSTRSVHWFTIWSYRWLVVKADLHYRASRHRIQPIFCLSRVEPIYGCSLQLESTSEPRHIYRLELSRRRVKSVNDLGMSVLLVVSKQRVDDPGHPSDILILKAL